MKFLNKGACGAWGVGAWSVWSVRALNHAPTLRRSPRSTVLTIPLLLALAVATSLLLADCGHSHDSSSAPQEKQLYTCGMHPQVVQDKPGNCPICGMKLTPIRKASLERGSVERGERGERKINYYKSTMNPGEVKPEPGKDSMGMDMVPVYEEEAAAGESSAIAIDSVTIQNMGIRTATVTRGPLRRIIRTIGTIDYDETALADVTTKFKGWIEKLHANATGTLVMRGDPLFEIYSPELYSAEVEYVLSLGDSIPTSATNTPARDSVQTSAFTKLKYFDVSEDQISELERTRQPRKTIRVNAPIDGFVIEKMAVAGQMVDPGMKLYRLADLGTVWVQAQIYEQDLVYIKLGQEATVTLSYFPDREFRGRVTYVYPNVDEKTRTARVRMEFHNPGYFLKPGMFAQVQVVSELEPSALLVPDMSILRSGEKNTVFVALDGGKFEPRIVTLGPQVENDNYQVLSGLSEGDRIVTSGQFMLDSESQLREAIQKMVKPQLPGVTDTSSWAARAQHAAHSESPLPIDGKGVRGEVAAVKYICPMPDHVSIEYDLPGKCPLCGMALVPVSQATLQKLQPGGKLLHYTCPMPEHSDVRSDKPGKCPKCGMTLIPVLEPPPLPTNAVPTRTSLRADGAAKVLYTCPMASHAEVVTDKPGKCPMCDMDLVATSTVSHGKIAEEHWRKLHGP